MAQELKRFDVIGKYTDEETMYEFRPDGVCYDADEVDAVLAEKEAEIQTLKQKLMKYGDTNAFLVKENTDLKLITESKDTEIRRLQRALYKACANWAMSERYTEATWHGDEHREELWANVQAKCRAKADEYR